MREHLKRLMRRVSGLLLIGAVRQIDDAAPAQRAQFSLRDGEVKDAIVVLLPYGFTAVVKPPDAAGAAESLVVAVDPDRRVALPPSDRRYRPTDLQPGEAMLYDDQGQWVRLCRDGIHLRTPFKADVDVGTVLTVTAPAGVRLVTPELAVTGEIIDRADAGGRSMSAMRAAFNDHVHPENDAGGPTGTPTAEM